MKNKIDLNQWNKETKMKKLIHAAMDRFDPDELLELMYEKCCNGVQREYLRDKMINMVTFEGGIFIRVESVAQQSKIEDFVKTEVYPYYNEQQTNIFSY